MRIKKGGEFRYESFVLTFALEQEDGVDEKTKGWMMPLQAQVRAI